MLRSTRLIALASPRTPTVLISSRFISTSPLLLKSPNEGMGEVSIPLYSITVIHSRADSLPLPFIHYSPVPPDSDQFLQNLTEETS